MSKKKARPSLAQDKKLVGLLALAAVIIIGLLVYIETNI